MEALSSAVLESLAVLEGLMVSLAIEKDRGLHATAWITLAFTLHWAWQTCVLYLPTEVPQQAASPWYLQNLLGLLAYSGFTAAAPRLQSIVRLPAPRWIAAGLLVCSCILGSEMLADLRASFAGTILTGCLTALGGTLITTCRFDILCHIEHNRQRTGVVLLATIGQLLVYLILRSLPHSIALTGTYVIPICLAFSIGRAYRALQDTPKHIEPPSKSKPLPSVQLLAFFLLALSLNFMRALVETMGGATYGTGYTVGLTVFITIIFVSLELMLGERNAERLAPFSIVAFMSVAAVTLLVGQGGVALASAFSAAGFYVFVALFWQATSGYPNGRLGGTVFVSSATHAIYTAGLLAGQLVYRALDRFETAGLFGPLLVIANVALAAAFVLYIRDLEKKRQPDRQLYLAPGLMGTLEADGELLARKAHLTNKEKQAVVDLASGKSVAAIARAQCVSENTVKTHVSHAYRKLAVHSREELMELICKTDAERLEKAREFEGGEP